MAKLAWISAELSRFCKNDSAIRVIFPSESGDFPASEKFLLKFSAEMAGDVAYRGNL
jgi:hypothetical protein